MGRKKPKKLRRRLLNSYVTVAISMSLVLFLLGLMGLMLINTHQITKHIKENIGITLLLFDDSKDVEVQRLQKNLNASTPVKSTRFITKEDAADELKIELGEDFVDFLGYNPLLSSVEVKVYADYANPDSLAILEKNYLENPLVKDVYYQKSFVDVLNRNVNRLTMAMLVLSVLMLVIFFALINNSIRLSIYSKRFDINTMKLVGATRQFIRRPFVFRSILHGIYGSTIACVGLFLLIFNYQKEVNDLVGFEGIRQIGLLFLAIYMIGILISSISTFFAVNKYLRMRFDELFY